MSYRSLPDRETRTVRSYCVPSESYIPRRNRRQKSRQVLRASHPNIRLVPKRYFFMGTSSIWLVPRGFVNNQSQPEIKLQALWSPKYSGQYIVHESVVRNLKCQSLDNQRIGSLTVTACVDLDWTDSDHPVKGWTTNTNRFYVTEQNLPDGVQVIIASDRGSQDLQANTSNMAAPVQNPILRPSARQEQERRDAEARAQRERDKKREAEKNLKEYQREQAELQQRPRRQQKVGA